MNTETENGTQVTLEQYMQPISRQQTSGVSDSPVRISPSPENRSDFMETVQACFSELCTWLDKRKKTRNPLSCSLRTLKICLVLLEDGISPDFSLKWTGGGYDAEWQVLNSTDFGVPQNRERCFVVGRLRGRSTAEVFPLEGADTENNLLEVKQIAQIFGTEAEPNPSGGRVYDAAGGYCNADTRSRSRHEPALHSTAHRINIIGRRKGNFTRMMQIFDPDGITEALDTAQGGGRGHYTIEIIGTLDAKRHSQMDVMGVNGIAPTLDTMHEPKKIAIPVLTPDRANKRQNGRRFKENGEAAFTLTGQDRHEVGINVSVDNDNIIVDGGGEHPNLFVRLSEECTVYAIWHDKYECYIAIRKLTPRECFRLQGWPDEYFDRAQMVNSDSQLYKQAGNGVTVPVIAEIAKRMEVTG